MNGILESIDELRNPALSRQRAQPFVGVAVSSSQRGISRYAILGVERPIEAGPIAAANRPVSTDGFRWVSHACAHGTGHAVSRSGIHGCGAPVHARSEAAQDARVALRRGSLALGVWRRTGHAGSPAPAQISAVHPHGLQWQCPCNRRISVVPARDGIETGVLLARYAVQLREGCLEHYVRLGPTDTCPPDAEEWFAYLETSGDVQWFNQQAYVDTLSPGSAGKISSK